MLALAVLTGAYGSLTDNGAAIIVATGLALMAAIPLLGWTRAALAGVIAVATLRGGFITGPEMPGRVWIGIQVVGLLIFAVGAWHERKPRTGRQVLLIIGLWAIFVTATGLSALTSPHLAYALHQVAPMACASGLLLAIYVVRWRQPRLATADLQVVLVVLTVLTAWGTIAFLSGSWWATSGFGRMSGLTVNSNYAGAMAAMALPLALCLPMPGATERQKTLLRYIGFLTLWSGVLLSGSRGAAAAAIIGGSVALWLTPRVSSSVRAGTQAMLVMLLVLAVAPTLGVTLPTINPSTESHLTGVSTFERKSIADDPLSGRGAIYRELVNRFEAHPVTGSGFGTTPLYNSHGQQGHDLYLSLLAETGVVGLLAFLAFLTALVIASGFPRAPSLAFGAAVTVLLMEVTETSLFGFGSPAAVAAWTIVLCAAHRGAERRTYVAKIERPTPAA